MIDLDTLVLFGHGFSSTEMLISGEIMVLIANFPPNMVIPALKCVAHDKSCVWTPGHQLVFHALKPVPPPLPFNLPMANIAPHIMHGQLFGPGLLPILVIKWKTTPRLYRKITLGLSSLHICQPTPGLKTVGDRSFKFGNRATATLLQRLRRFCVDDCVLNVFKLLIFL